MAIKKESPQSFNNQPNSSNPAISSGMGEQIMNRDEYYESVLEILRVGNDFHQEHPTSEEKDELNSDDELICLEQLTILQQQPIEFPQVSKLTQDSSSKTMQEITPNSGFKFFSRDECNEFLNKRYQEALQDPDAVILTIGNDLQQEHPTSKDKDELTFDDEPSFLEQFRILKQQHIESSKRMQEKVRIYWNSLNLEKKQGYLEVGISDLLRFSKKFVKAKELLEEALSFAEVHQKWDFWVCCCCNEKFTDSESHFEHIVGTHLKRSVPEQTSLIFPLRVDENWVSMINNENWEPADAHVVFTVLEKQLALRSESCRKGKKVPKFELKEYDPKTWANGSFFGGSWPISDDFGRRACLKTIQFWLKEILRNKHFLAIHLDHVIKQAMDKLQSEFRGGSLWDLGLHQSHLCICLLGALELLGILIFLNKTCLKISEETRVMNAILNLSTLSLETKEMFVLKNNSLCLLWDKHSLCEGSAKTALNSDHKAKEPPNSDSFLSWIFLAPSNENHLESWENLRKKRIYLGRKVLFDFVNGLKKQKEELVASDKDWCTNKIKLSKKDEWILQFAEDIHQFEYKINSYAAVDCREILTFLVKSYIKMRLEETVRNDTMDKSGNDATDKPDGGGGGRDSSGENYNVGADQSKKTAAKMTHKSKKHGKKKGPTA